ncbi:hypothetical protein [Flavobacterium beibuense]|uniref:Lipoprotein n=1 Tax=Flavobacterium beibuense TaxID=657326 RepID=A0A444WF24_9FLAO|nr:hypothetical protein [Flavobacterium beibuense]RYJ44453.1 hypothetical protein NU09_1063 [Flavobacterium beibuense]
MKPTRLFTLLFATASLLTVTGCIEDPGYGKSFNEQRIKLGVPTIKFDMITHGGMVWEVKNENEKTGSYHASKIILPIGDNESEHIETDIFRRKLNKDMYEQLAYTAYFTNDSTVSFEKIKPYYFKGPKSEMEKTATGETKSLSITDKKELTLQQADSILENWALSRIKKEGVVSHKHMQK